MAVANDDPWRCRYHHGKGGGRGGQPPRQCYIYQVKGLSGRLLKLKKSWWKSIPSSKKEEDSGKKEGRLFPPPLPTVKLGIKPAFELFPSSLINRVKAYRKKIFDQECNAYIANVQKELAAWQDKFVAGSKKPTPDDIRTSEDLQAKLDILMDKEWESEDPGGEDVEKATTGGLFKERQYGTISTVDQYNYGVNFYDDATVLSMWGLYPSWNSCGSHCGSGRRSRSKWGRARRTDRLDQDW
ncbi:tripeptidyl-peptidase II [Nitzschia inconspicua]|uniref:Tripeptidyl-peptidase II n=1 Tax=Nitzschia inconspicua TaxID=303405 RepID=A0A9K3K5Y5_9STRA|nr:tripeptidyl-peptidase II [Nitzschia inconspicua]